MVRALRDAGLRARNALIVLACITLAGCAPVHSTTGVIVTDYAEDHVVPYVQTSDDPYLAGCGTATGQSHLLASFSRVMDDPHPLMFYNGAMAGYCAELRAAEADLRHLRARFAGEVEEAQDARIVEKRWRAVAAQRRYDAYQHFVAVYGDPGGACPSLGDDEDELTYMMGLLTGLQAMRSDIRSGTQVGVPRDIALKAARASECLDDERWWGVPSAIRATIWTIVPGAAPEGREPWTIYGSSADLAEASGMRLALGLYAMGAANLGDDDRLRRAIRAAARTGGEQAPERYRLLDRLTLLQIRHLSDRIWTRETGSRTPVGALGEFPGDPAQSEPDVEELL